MTVIDQIVMSVPPFFIGILLTVVFGLILHVFQPGSFDEAKGDPLSIFYVHDFSGPFHCHSAHCHDGQDAAFVDP